MKEINLKTLDMILLQKGGDGMLPIAIPIVVTRIVTVIGWMTVGKYVIKAGCIAGNVIKKYTERRTQIGGDM